MEIGWDEALDIVAEELKKIRETDPRKSARASGDFQRLYNWAWPAAFGYGNSSARWASTAAGATTRSTGSPTRGSLS